MTLQSIPVLLRPALCALAAYAGVVFALIGNGRDLSWSKVGLIGTFFFAAGGILTVVQHVRKQEYGWTRTFISVMALSLLVAVVLVLLKAAFGSA